MKICKCGEKLPDDAVDCPRGHKYQPMVAFNVAPIPQPEAALPAPAAPVPDQAAAAAAPALPILVPPFVAPTDDDYEKLRTKLENIETRGAPILITGFSNAGKSFCVLQAAKMADGFGYVAGVSKELIGQDFVEPNGALSTKHVQALPMSPAGEGAEAGRSDWSFIDVPGEFFAQLISPRSAGFAGTDDPQIRQLCAAIAIAKGIILVLPGPAAVGVRDRKAPEYVERDGTSPALSPYDAKDWDDLNQVVTDSMRMLGPLAQFLDVIDQDVQKGTRLEAFERYRALGPDEREGRLKAARRSHIPLSVMLTKADQIFGTDPAPEPVVVGEDQQRIDGNDPWLSLIAANRDKGDRAPYRVMTDNFRSVNLDFSSACVGGPLRWEEQIVDPKDNSLKTVEKREIPPSQYGKGRGIWEPLLWLLRRIEENGGRRDWLERQAERHPVLRTMRTLFTRKGLAEWVRHHDRAAKSPFDVRRETDREFAKLTEKRSR